MTLFKLKAAPTILIEDDLDKNVVPLLQEIVNQDKSIHFFCFEHPPSIWRRVFNKCSQVIFHEAFDEDIQTKYSNTKRAVVIDSVNQMSLSMGWNQCLKFLLKLISDSNVEVLVLILHRDCITSTSKLQLYLHHIANAIVTYDPDNSCRLQVKLKKGNKVIKSTEDISYDTKTSMLKLTPIIQERKVEEQPDKPSPGTLSTFKIEVDQIDKMEKSKLKLPYMSKINEGESKVFYEPDAVDDWDEEDPDEDLDI